MKNFILIISLFACAFSLSAEKYDLFFTVDQVFNNSENPSEDKYWEVKLENEFISILLTTVSPSADITNSNGYYGTADEYIRIPYRFRPGTRSTNGINSKTMGTIELEKDGTLTIYAQYSSTDQRMLQVVQKDNTLLDEALSNATVVKAADNDSRDVYPVYTVQLKKGTAYLLWPTNQVYFHGFSFEPKTDPTLPVAYETAELFFPSEYVGDSTELQANFTLEHNNTSVTFNTTADKPIIDESSSSIGYYGTPDEYETLTVRYRPGGNSRNGVNSPTKGVFTFPSAGTLYIYAYNNMYNDNDTKTGPIVRTLQLVQDDNYLFDQTFSPEDAVAGTLPSGKACDVYPVYSVEVNQSQAYLLWPEGQVMMHGFRFVPEKSLFLHITDSDGNFVETFNHQIYEVPYVVTKVNKNTYRVNDVYFDEEVYFVLADGLFENPVKGSPWSELPEGTRIFLQSTEYTPRAMANDILPTTAAGFEVVDASEVTSVKPFFTDGGGRTITLSLDSDNNGTVSIVDNPTTGVEEIVVPGVVTDGRMYNIMGQPVDENYRGIVIKDGKKYMQIPR